MWARWLVRLYPQAWRARYEAEIIALLEAYHVTPRTVLDLLWHALAAWLDPVYCGKERVSPMQRVRTANVTLLAFLPLFIVTCFVWEVGSDSTHDNALLTPLNRYDITAWLPWTITEWGISAAVLALLATALIASGLTVRRAIATRQLAPVPLVLPVIAFAAVFSVTVFVGMFGDPAWASFTSAMTMPMIVLILISFPCVALAYPIVMADSEPQDHHTEPTSLRRSRWRPLVAVFIVFVCIVAGMQLRAHKQPVQNMLVATLIIAAIIVLPCVALLQSAPRNRASESLVAGPRWLSPLLFVLIAVTTIAMAMAALAAVAWTIRVWALPLDGPWHSGIAMELAAMAVLVISVARALVGATPVRRVATAA